MWCVLCTYIHIIYGYIWGILGLEDEFPPKMVYFEDACEYTQMVNMGKCWYQPATRR